jgi:hypothetical protein
MCCCDHIFYLKDNVFVMGYVMFELCQPFHIGTMYYVSLCTMYYVMYELCLWFFPMA